MCVFAAREAEINGRRRRMRILIFKSRLLQIFRRWLIVMVQLKLHQSAWLVWARQKTPCELVIIKDIEEWEEAGREESLWQYDNTNINNLNTLFYPSSTISYRVVWDFKSIKQGQSTLNRWTTLITKTKLRILSPAPVSLILLERSRTWQLSCERLQSVLGRSRDIILSEIPRNYPERDQ